MLPPAGKVAVPAIQIADGKSIVRVVVVVQRHAQLLQIARALRPPRRFPVWLAGLFAGRFIAGMATEMRGASNAKARRELGWEPRYPSWRQGFREALA